jgi:hypothetical protein
LRACHGAVADADRSSIVVLPSGIVINAQIMDNETGTHDRLVNIDIKHRTVTLSIDDDSRCLPAEQKQKAPTLGHGRFAAKFRQACWRLSPLFHEGAQNFRVINFDHVGSLTAGETNGTIFLPARSGLARNPGLKSETWATRLSCSVVIQSACHLDGMESGRRKLVWCFPSCQNCSIKRTH